MTPESPVPVARLALHLLFLLTSDHMKNPSRKFVELIHAASSKWANWDPPNQIKVGDYGTINRETGNFEKEGNIYEDSDPTIANLAVQHKPLMGPPDDSIIISSAGVIHNELIVPAKSEIVGLVNSSIKGQWKFGSRRGALLAISRPVTSYVPPKVLLKHLVNIPILKNKVLVTEVVSCPAYAIYLSTANNEVVELALITGDEEARWWSRNESGMMRQACDRDGLYNYTPLYTLKKIRQNFLLRR